MNKKQKTMLIEKYFLKFINKINSEEIKNFLFTVLYDYVPDYFWIMPGSTSGKYHNVDECKAEGNLLHTYRVCGIVSHLIEGVLKTNSVYWINCLYTAAILHDSFKCGFAGRENYYKGKIATDSAHPYYVRSALQWVEYKDEEWFNDVMEIIEGHMGKWSPIPLTKEIDNAQSPTFILYLADYMASRKIESWFDL